MANENNSNNDMQDMMVAAIGGAMQYRHMSIRMLSIQSGVPYATLYRCMNKTTTFNPQIFSRLMQSMKVEFNIVMKPQQVKTTVK